MEKISAEMAGEQGISAQHTLMDNGERRYRLVASDGSSYIRTEASVGSGWQNSHYHKSLLETYIVQSEWQAFVELDGEEIRVWIMRPGDVYTTRPGVSHNAYLPAGAITHVVKHSGQGDADWISDPLLDARTKHLTEAQVLAAANGLTGPPLYPRL